MAALLVGKRSHFDIYQGMCIGQAREAWQRRGWGVFMRHDKFSWKCAKRGTGMKSISLQMNIRAP